MRSALLCVLFAFIVHKESCCAADEDFRPTPIPLTSWNIGGTDLGAGSDGPDAGTLQETLATDAPPAVVAVPAHYWEDALRHSVYLTLVRDKIDQIIAKTEKKPDSQISKDEDHDLWEKIKSAPFDRLKAEEPSNLGDIAVMAKGRLLEESSGFRFTEDELKKEKCKENCTESVKAFWSVKRVRQRDAETVPGKHHYELTFSVSSQTPKKQNRPYENPVRTFTVREGTPVERPQYRPQYGPLPQRPQRAIWVHKNIVPTHPPQQQESSLDRLFFSWFGSDEESYEPPIKKFRYSHPPPQRSKVGHVGSQSEQHNQKLVPYTYKSHSYKAARPLGPPPVQHSQYHYSVDSDAVRPQHQYTPPTPTEYKHVSSNIIKTTKPAVLPTPPSSFPLTNETANITSSIETTTPTKDSDIITAFTTYSKPKPTKVNYFHEQVRPPIFNAPPGVFVTMDHKKPFKPMPPLKFMHSQQKPSKHRPVDFRPSPQVLDVHSFSDPEPSDSFRPIAMSYAGSNTTESSELAVSDKVHNFRKTKPPKKHDKSKPTRTTSAPDIITASNDVLDGTHWANILGAYTKTTSMDFTTANETETSSETVTQVSSEATEIVTEKSTTKHTTEPAPKITSTTTTGKPRRTRPPPKVENPLKVKKHKRVTSTTTTSTTSTEAPASRRPIQDLTPQASSTSVGGGSHETQSNAKIENITISTTPMSVNETSDMASTTEYSAIRVNPTTTRTTTTTRKATTRQTPTTTKTPAPSSTIETPTSSITQPRNNRFRQSTLMIKGTSVKHDKWNVPFVNKTNSTTERIRAVRPLNKKVLRRKGSNFHGYVSSTPKTMSEEHRESHEDHVADDLHVLSIGSTTETVSLSTQASSTSREEPAKQIGSESNLSGTEDPDEDDEDDDDSENEDNESQEHDEYSSTAGTIDSKELDSSDTSNEVEIEIVSTTEAMFDVATANYAVKNKTKCKNKKQNATTTDTSIPENIVISKYPIEDEVSVRPKATTEKMSTSDFFDEIFGFNIEQNETGHNRSESRYVDNDDDLEEFLQSINKKPSINEKHEEYSDEEKEDSPFNNDEENRFPRNVDRTYEDYEDNPLSFLELMAME